MDETVQQQAKGSYRSAIERCDTIGVSGWCLRVDVPHEPLSLALSCDGVVLARFATDRIRKDLRHPLASDETGGAMAGFSFNWSTLDEAARTRLLAQLTNHLDRDVYDCVNIVTPDGHVLDCAWARRQNQVIGAGELRDELKISFLNPVDLEAEVRAGEHEKWLRSPVYQDHLEFIRCAAGGLAFADDLKLRLSRRSHSTWVGCELLRLSGLRVRRLEELKPDEQHLLAQSGISLDRLEAIRAQLVPPIEDDLVNLGNSPSDSDLRKRRIAQEDRYGTFQDEVVKNRGFKFANPFTGAPARLVDSVKIFDRQVFTFADSEMMQIISGGNMNSVVGIYFMKLNIFVLLDKKEKSNSQNYYTSTKHMLDLMVIYQMRLVKHYDLFLESLRASSQDISSAMVAVHGRAENPAHHSWNYLSAFERLSKTGLLKNIDMVVRPPTEYYGPVEQMYPDLAHAELISFPEMPAIDPFPFSPRHVVLQLGGNFITRELKQHIHSWAMGQVSKDFLREVEEMTSARTPLIWIGLRVGDKSWVEQVEGVAQLVEMVVERYPKAMFLLDGFSRISADAVVPAKWEPAVNALKDVVAEIIGKCKFPGAIHSLMGNTLAESVVWAGVVDAYVAPLGSSQHKVGWHSECPGIVFTSERVMGRPAALRPGGWEAEDSKIPHYFAGTTADTGQRRGTHDYRVNLDNLSIPADVLGQELLQLLAQTSKSAPGPFGAVG